MATRETTQARRERLVNEAIAEAKSRQMLRQAVVAARAKDAEPEPISLLLWCPACGERHIDWGAWGVKVHHTHACQKCGMVWRPAVQPTRGVVFLPGFKNEGE